jgi:hypothetical protein
MVLVLVAWGCSESKRTAQPLASETAAIVGGDRERGHPAVGAMVRGDGRAFCTGTLIRDRWVLTAAHCFNGGANPDNVFFYIGDRARQDGRTVGSVEVIRHPAWSSQDLIGIYDIALVRLAEAVDDPAPYGLFDGDVEALIDSPLFFVGFGANQGDPARGSGTKRSTSLRLRGVSTTMLFHDHDGSGVCFGDSGGPALHQVGDDWMVVGVNSSVRGDPVCLDESLQVRVDAFLPWIQRVLEEDRGCAADPAQCGCAAACVEGVCDPLGCPPDTPCRTLVRCLQNCRNDSICQATCYSDAAPAARDLYDETVACGAAECSDVPDTNACMAERCPTLQQCFDDIESGAQTCREVADCARRCQNGNCVQLCVEDGSPMAQAAYTALSRCVNTTCAGLNGVERQRCQVENCTAEWHGCLPPDDCAITGGDCPEGTACRREAWSGLYCVPTDDIPTGDGCLSIGVVCEDGSICDSRGQGQICRPICLDAAEHCQPGQECVMLPNRPIEMGVCVGCVDTDLDGACDDEDCAPADPARSPQAQEICDDGVDQDCDDVVDEGCEVDQGVPADMGMPDQGAVDAAMSDPDARQASDQAVDMPSEGDRAVDAAPAPMVIERNAVADDGCRAQPGSGAGWIWGLALLIGLSRRRGSSPS